MSPFGFPEQQRKKNCLIFMPMKTDIKFWSLNYLTEGNE